MRILYDHKKYRLHFCENSFFSWIATLGKVGFLRVTFSKLYRSQNRVLKNILLKILLGQYCGFARKKWVTSLIHNFITYPEKWVFAPARF